jgi:hypothetical protein
MRSAPLPWITSGGQLALVLHTAMDVNVSTSIRESVMSQKVNEKQNPRASVTSKQKVQEPPITGLSPDDPLGGGSDSTGKPGGPIK